MSSPNFYGSNTALVTPFSQNGSVDEKAFADFINWQIEQGTTGLVPMGTTGESATVSHEEHMRVVELCVEVANGRVPVMAGAGSNNTTEAVAYAEHAAKVGADALLVVTPYYNKPNQRGMKAHFGAVAQATPLPNYIYNIPGRSIVDMTPETMGELVHEYSNIVGVKDATADMVRVTQQRATCGKDFVQLSAEDPSALGFNAHGGKGCISVTANVAPALCAEFQTAMAENRWDDALVLQDRLMPLHKAMFAEPSPGGAKYALELLGKMQNIIRSPIVTIEESTQKIVRDAMIHAGILN